MNLVMASAPNPLSTPYHTAQTHLNPKPLRQAQTSHLASQATGTQLPFDSCHLLHGLLAEVSSGMLTMKGFSFCTEHTTPHETTMACSQQCLLQVIAVDLVAVGQFLQVYVSNSEMCGCFICLGFCGPGSS